MNTLKLTRRKGWRTRPPSSCYEVYKTGRPRLWLGTIFRSEKNVGFYQNQSVSLSAAKLREIAKKMEGLEVA